jgi:hypothetical protein
MQTKICDGADKFGEEIFRVTRVHSGVSLICNLFKLIVKTGILPEDLEYKTCRLDLMLTGKLLQHFSDAAQTFLTPNFS